MTQVEMVIKYERKFNVSIELLEDVETITEPTMSMTDIQNYTTLRSTNKITWPSDIIVSNVCPHTAECVIKNILKDRKGYGGLNVYVMHIEDLLEKVMVVELGHSTEVELRAYNTRYGILLRPIGERYPLSPPVTTFNKIQDFVSGEEEEVGCEWPKGYKLVKRSKRTNMVIIKLYVYGEGSLTMHKNKETMDELYETFRGISGVQEMDVPTKSNLESKYGVKLLNGVGTSMPIAPIITEEIVEDYIAGYTYKVEVRFGTDYKVVYGKRTNEILVLEHLTNYLGFKGEDTLWFKKLMSDGYNLWCYEKIMDLDKTRKRRGMQLSVFKSRIERIVSNARWDSIENKLSLTISR